MNDALLTPNSQNPFFFYTVSYEDPKKYISS